MSSVCWWHFDLSSLQNTFEIKHWNEQLSLSFEQLLFKLENETKLINFYGNRFAVEPNLKKMNNAVQNIKMNNVKIVPSNTVILSFLEYFLIPLLDLFRILIIQLKKQIMLFLDYQDFLKTHSLMLNSKHLFISLLSDQSLLMVVLYGWTHLLFLHIRLRG